jgi:hypothetical protein
MSDSKELQVREAQLAPVQEPSVGLMLQTMIERGITSENVEALTRLCDLKVRLDDRNSEQSFASAFSDLQAELPTVAATKAVPNKDGSIRYHFAPYEEIMATLKPLLAKHGFSVSFDSKFGEGRITVTCTLMHRGGHQRSNSFAVRIGGGPPGSTETQADGAAKTYGKRGALCDALNIVVDHDDDARGLGQTITPEQANELRDRCAKANVDERAFLKYAQAAGFEHITAERLDDIETMLVRKEITAGIRNKSGDINW